MNAMGLSSIDSGRSAGGPYSSLENGWKPITELGVFKSSMKRTSMMLTLIDLRIILSFSVPFNRLTHNL